MLKWLVLCTSIVYLSGCTQCDECDILVSEPTVPLQIFNQDSLSQVSTLLTTLSTQIEALDLQVTELETTRSSFEDSVTVLTDLIAQDSIQYEATLASVNDLLASINASYSRDSLSLADLTEQNELYTTALSELETGLTRIDTIYDLDTDNFIVNTDSTELYSLPLSPGLNTINYRLIIGQRRFDLSIVYETELYEDEKSRVGSQARNIAVASHSFDSLTVDCTENCISTNGKIVAYH
ncbi:MAG: hypothetical protein RIF33_07875 [Cyclobacteriaceae bacterium]